MYIFYKIDRFFVHNIKKNFFQIRHFDKAVSFIWYKARADFDWKDIYLPIK